MLSLGFANRDWLALRAGRRGGYTNALRLVEHAPGPGGKTEAVTLTEAEQLLYKTGFELVTASGVGVFAEAGDDDLGRAERAALVELERLVAGRACRSSARTLHRVARRRVFVLSYPKIVCDNWAPGVPCRHRRAASSRPPP